MDDAAQDPVIDEPEAQATGEGAAPEVPTEPAEPDGRATAIDAATIPADAGESEGAADDPTEADGPAVTAGENTPENQAPGGPTAEPDAEPAQKKAAHDNPDEALRERAEEEGVSMMELLMEEGDYLPESFERGDIVTGHVLRKEDNQIIVDVGAKREGLVPSSDIAKLPKGMLAEIAAGDEVEVVVLRRPVGDGELLVSLSQALSRVDWRRAKEVMESGEILEEPVSGANKGGVTIEFGALQGFVPKSHLVSLPSVPAGTPPMDQMKLLVGRTIPVKIIEVNRRQRRLIMSERRALREHRATQKKELLADLHEGEIRTGRVSSIADFGVFIDLGGADGLVHNSELTYERGRKPSELVKVGDEVQVYVLSLDRDRKRIGLSMKRLQQDPWATVEDDYYVGQIVDAQVSNLTKFGAFARLPNGLEGLIHISELSDEHLEDAAEILRPGQTVTVEILSIEPDRQRIGLSLRRVPEHLRTVSPPPEPAREEPAPSTPDVDESIASDADLDEGDDRDHDEAVAVVEDDGVASDHGAPDDDALVAEDTMDASAGNGDAPDEAADGETTDDGDAGSDEADDAEDVAEEADDDADVAAEAEPPAEAVEAEEDEDVESE